MTRVLFVASECYPLVKTGGLADVVGALPPALRRLGADVRLLLPGYPAVLDGLTGGRRVWTVPDLPGGGDGALVFGTGPDDLPIYALEAPHLYDRAGGPYAGPAGDWPDNPERFAALSWAAAWLAGPDQGWRWRPDIIHAHDWQAGLAPAYLALAGLRSRPATVITIHNIAYQGGCDAGLLGRLHLPPASYAVDGVEYYGRIGFLKAGLYYADRITTVSPSYAREIQTPEGGWGLEGLLAARRADLSGIVNGVDTGVWDPATDPHLALPYGSDTLDGKRANKAALQAVMGLQARHDAPLFGVVSRLTYQKGFDLLLEALPYLIDRGAQLALLGAGEGWLEDGFRAAAARWPGRVAVRVGYDEALSHQIQGGADVVVLPSRSEPCGLIQLYGLRYGTLPLVRRVGGLADTVRDGETGFVFDSATTHALVEAIGRAADLWWTDAEGWRRRQRSAMAQDWSWTRSAERYLALYHELYPAL